MNAMMSKRNLWHKDCHRTGKDFKWSEMKTPWEGAQERIDTMEKYNMKNMKSKGERWKKSKRNFLKEVKWTWEKVMHIKSKEGD